MLIAVQNHIHRFVTLYKNLLTSKRRKYIAGLVINTFCLLLVIAHGMLGKTAILTPLISPLQQEKLTPLTKSKSTEEIFGFAPYWTMNKLRNVDFTVLTTLAYFGVEVDSEGNMQKDDIGYLTFHSEKATDLFRKAHSNGTRVVLTLTQMDNKEIKGLMDNEDGQNRIITEAAAEVKNRGIDGINIDFEYSGNAGKMYRDKFTKFVSKLTKHMQEQVPDSQVTVSVYASSVKQPKIYDIYALGKEDIKIFMMAYDFGYRGSDKVMPTSPLYGYKEGKYWYDVSTAVEDFLALIPSKKLILGLPWYGYNYAIYGDPQEKAETRPTWSWRGGPKAQTYTIAKDVVHPKMQGILAYKEGWDDVGKVGWKAYYVKATDTWRMIFLDDSKSLEIKYAFAKEKSLGGVGMWALGFDDGKTEMWALLQKTFGAKKIADSRIIERAIN